MDCSQLVLSVIKDDSIKKNLNPIVYYCIKLIYDPEFSNRSRLFCRCIKNFFDIEPHLKMMYSYYLVNVGQGI